MIFKKSARYSHANTAALFNGIDLTEVYRFQPVQATQAKTALLLTPSDADAQRAGGTWRDIFDPDDFINRIPVIGWLALIEILGAITFPLAWFVFRALADRGFIFAKALGVLIPAWLAWVWASAHWLAFSRGSIFLAIILLALVSGAVVMRRGRAMLEYLRAHASLIFIEEILFLLFFAFFLLIRYGNPDLWHPNFGGEKPMDFAYLNAVIKSTWFPPYDPWFAGGFINYYYFGMVLTATLIKFSGIIPEVAYNLAIPLYFALTAMGAFSVVYNLIAHRHVIASREAAKQSPSSNFAIALLRSSQPQRSLPSLHSGQALAMTYKPLAFSFLGALFVAVIGNFGELFVLLDAFLRVGGGNLQSSPVQIAMNVLAGIVRVVTQGASLDVPTGNWYWTATRIIPDTINEFPFFTFLYADLHAHLMALPFTLVALGCAVNFAQIINDERNTTRNIKPSTVYCLWSVFLQELPILAITSLVVGALRPLNTWDYPTYLAVIACALAIGEYARRRNIDRYAVFSVAWKFFVIVVLSTLFFQPFISNYATAYTSIELWQSTRTTLPEYLVVHGIFLFAVATFLVRQTFDTRARRGVLRFLRLIVAKRARVTRLLFLHRALVAYPSLSEDLALIGFAMLVVLEFLLIITGLTVFALVIPLGVLATVIVVRPEIDSARRLIALLIGAALAMTLMVEVVTLRGDIGRMNTVFKFYLQVWIFLGVASAAGIGVFSHQSTVNSQRLIGSSSRITHHGSLRRIWWLLFAVLLFTGFMYPIFATRAKINDRFVAGDSAGLNGMDYMRGAVYYDQNKELILGFDRDAIQWLRENVAGSPVMLEGNAPLYHWGARVSIYTGLPTIIGWDWHQKQQRSIVDGAIIDHRIEVVSQIYNTRDPSVALENLKRYRVTYIYVGDLERAFYNAEGLAKFDAMTQGGILELVYQNERVKIFKMKN
ncbi:MAG: hypothetical protein HY070_07270 [Chloroflexi bacterium]|nr:hypothetical protein [Chloroflexota bacterium]